MERITADEAARTFHDLLGRVRHEGATFEIIDGGEVIARMAPVEAQAAKLTTLGELVEAMRRWPRLDPEDSIAFEADLADIRRSFPMPENKWD